ncbi:MAG: hypothetical protein KAH21_07290 [Spirochaetaceae bacterium]|nr:hypothetical protein [Spirochaetaceae bacterium]
MDGIDFLYYPVCAVMMKLESIRSVSYFWKFLRGHLDFLKFYPEITKTAIIKQSEYHSKKAGQCPVRLGKFLNKGIN